MPQYMILEIDDNTDAAALYKKLQPLKNRIRVIGLFTKADQLCECPVRSAKSVLGSRFRWWLCPECKRPKSGTPQMLVKNKINSSGSDNRFHIRLCVRWYKTPEGGVRTAMTGEDTNIEWY